MRSSRLQFRATVFALLLVGTACGDDGDDDHEVMGDATGSEDAGAIDREPDASGPGDIREPAEKRDEPACVDVGTGTEATRTFVPKTDYFPACRGNTNETDEAFVWAPSATGTYELWASTADLNGAALEVRPGACKDGEVPRSICAPGVGSEDGTVSKTLMFLEEGQPITVIVDAGSARYDRDDYDNYTLNEFVLRISPYECPAMPVSLQPDDPEGHQVRIDRGTGLQGISCLRGRYQAQVGFTAPAAGSYRFGLKPGFASDEASVFLALLDETCGGDELACAAEQAHAEITHELAEDQTVIVVVETDQDEGEGGSVRLDIEALTQPAATASED